MEKQKNNTKQKIKSQLREKTVGYIAAGFGLVSALAWNEAIKELINVLFPIDKNSLLAKFIYALLVTLIAVLVTIYLMKLFKKEETKK